VRARQCQATDGNLALTLQEIQRLTGLLVLDPCHAFKWPRYTAGSPLCTHPGTGTLDLPTRTEQGTVIRATVQQAVLKCIQFIRSAETGRSRHQAPRPRYQKQYSTVYACSAHGKPTAGSCKCSKKKKKKKIGVAAGSLVLTLCSWQFWQRIACNFEKLLFLLLLCGVSMTLNITTAACESGERRGHRRHSGTYTE